MPYLRFTPGARHLSRFRLDRSRRWRIHVEVFAEKEVELRFFREIHAVRQETACEGKEVYAFEKGRRFTASTGDPVAGGWWLVEVISRVEQTVEVESFAEALT